MMRRVGLAGVLPDLPRGVDQRRLELGHREEAPLVLQRPFVRARRCDQAGVGMPVGEVQAEGGGLEHRPAVLDVRRRATQRVHLAVLVGALLLARDDDDVDRRARLLGEPEDAGGAGAGLVIEAHRATVAERASEARSEMESELDRRVMSS